jgi:hypothetical protein
MNCTPLCAQGWYRDPFGRHEDRYFSVGHPTKLVRDATAESYDPPPWEYPMRMPLVPVVPRAANHRGADDTRRADDMQRDREVDLSRKAYETMARCGD